MSCICQRVKSIPVCVTSITIGTILDTNTVVTVLIKNKTLGIDNYFLTTSDGFGVVILEDFEYNFSPSFFYEIYILVDGNITQFQIDAYTIVECAAFEVVNIKKASIEELEYLLNVTMEV